MFLQVLSADIPYADIAFFVILALGLLLGILRGFSKSFKGFFLTIGIMLAALLILSPTFAKVREISVFQKMETSITQGIEKKSELLSQPIYVVTDEKGNRTFFVDVTQDGVTERVNLETVIANSDMSGALKGKLTLWLAQKFIYKDGQSIGAVAGVFISDIIVAIIAYIAYCLVLGLICWLLRKILQKCTTRTTNCSKHSTALAVQSYRRRLPRYLSFSCLPYSMPCVKKSRSSIPRFASPRCADISTLTTLLQNY